MIDWVSVVRDMKFKVDEIRKHVKFYDYSNQNKSVHTDSSFIEYIQDELRKSKSRLFDITDVSFGRKIRLSRDFQNLRDELDIFLDEIKLRHCEWKDLDEGWVEKIVDLDHDIINGIRELNKKLDSVLKEILDFRHIKIKNHAVIYEKDFWKGIAEDYEDVGRQIDSLVIMFKQRETSCNIREITLERTFRKMKREIESKV